MHQNLILKKTLNDVRESETVKDIFKKYKIDLNEIDLIPICFKKDLDVSARTEHGCIYLNSKLLKKPETISSYICHEVAHFLQQSTAEGPTQGSTDDTYLDNKYEIEGFKQQNSFISEIKGKPAAESYTDKLLDHHGLKGKERQEKKKELLQLASSKLTKHKQLSLDFPIPTIINPSKLDKTKQQLMEDYDLAIEKGPQEQHPRPKLERLHPIEQEYRKKKLKELMSLLNKDSNDAAYFWDESGEFNKESPSDRAFTDPNQKRFKFRDISKSIRIFIKTLNQLTPEEVSKLKRLKMAKGNESDMGEFWINIDKGIKLSLVEMPIAIIAKDQDNGNYIGWVLLRPHLIGQSKFELEIDTFVDKAYRGEGVGLMLMNKTKEYANTFYPESEILVGPWSPTASVFYSKTNMLEEADPYDRSVGASEELEEEEQQQEFDKVKKQIEEENKQQLDLPFEGWKQEALEMAKKHLKAADRYFGDVEGEHNRSTKQDSVGDEEYNSDQLKLKFRDLLKDITIKIVKYKDFTSEDKDKLTKLTLRQNSSMNTAMTNYPLKELNNATAIIAIDKNTNEYLGWILLNPKEFLNEIEIDTFVDRAFRGEGLGSYLINQAQSFVKINYPKYKIKAESWSNPSRNFYEKVDLIPKKRYHQTKQLSKEEREEESKKRERYFQELDSRYNTDQEKLPFSNLGGEDRSWLYNRR